MRFVYSENLFAKTVSRAKFSMPHIPAPLPKLIRAGELVFREGEENILMGTAYIALAKT